MKEEIEKYMNNVVNSKNYKIFQNFYFRTYDKMMKPKEWTRKKIIMYYIQMGMAIIGMIILLVIKVNK